MGEICVHMPTYFSVFGYVSLLILHCCLNFRIFSVRVYWKEYPIIVRKNIKILRKSVSINGAVTEMWAG